MNIPKFPVALITSVVIGKKVYVHGNFTDEELIEYMNWKADLGLLQLTDTRLSWLLKCGLYKQEITEIFNRSTAFNKTSGKKKAA